MRHYYFLFFAALSLILPIRAHSMELSPTGYRITADPQSAELLSFTLTNTTERVQRYHVSVRDGVQPDNASAIALWFRLPDSITLAPSETTVFEVEAYIPPTATPGDRYTYLIVSQESEMATVGSQPEAGIPITITVAGEIEETVQVRDMRLSRGHNVLTGQIELINTGNIEAPIIGQLLLLTDNGVLSEAPIHIRLRAGDTHAMTLEAAHTSWYVGPIVLQARMQYGALEKDIIVTERIFMVGTSAVFGAACGGMLLLFLGIYLSRKKKRYVA